MPATRPTEVEKRLLAAAARALERCQVADDPSGAADEAAAILEQVVTLNGTYVPPERPRPASREAERAWPGAGDAP